MNAITYPTTPFGLIIFMERDGEGQKFLVPSRHSPSKIQQNTGNQQSWWSKLKVVYIHSADPKSAILSIGPEESESHHCIFVNIS